MGNLTCDAIVHLLGGETMTARCKATRSAHQAWVGVVSLEPRRTVYLNTADADALGRMRVQWFEMADELLQYSDIGVEDASSSELYVVSGSLEFEEMLERLGIEASTLAFKSATGYPL